VEFFEYVYDVAQLNTGFLSYLFLSLGVIGVRGRFNDNFHIKMNNENDEILVYTVGPMYFGLNFQIQ
jgi:hypothetical protein